jgi:hypothetical protein
MQNICNMDKLEQERDVHTDFYRKGENAFVSVTWLHDYAHDIGVEVEVDMDKRIVNDARFIFERYPEKKCVLVNDMAKSLIGMTVGLGVGEEILKRFAGKEGCENVMSLLFLGVAGIGFICYINNMKDGKITFDDFAKEIPSMRDNACIAFNKDALLEAWKGSMS